MEGRLEVPWKAFRTISAYHNTCIFKRVWSYKLMCKWRLYSMILETLTGLLKHEIGSISQNWKCRQYNVSRDFPGGSVVKNLPTKLDRRIWSLGQKDPLEETTHSSIIAWETPWTEEPGGLQSMGSPRIGQELVTEQHHHYNILNNSTDLESDIWVQILPLLFLKYSMVQVFHLYKQMSIVSIS